jgi:hypothetical protein
MLGLHLFGTRGDFGHRLAAGGALGFGGCPLAGLVLGVGDIRWHVLSMYDKHRVTVSRLSILNHKLVNSHRYAHANLAEPLPRLCEVTKYP